MVPVIHYQVPLYSQISDISSAAWQQKGCGVADLAMLIEFYKPDTTSVDKVLAEALKAGAYQTNVGWKHDGLAALAVKHGLTGKTYDLSQLGKEDAFKQFESILKDGPVIASIHRGFDPKSSYGHLVVITGMEDGTVYYNDPGKRDGKREIAVANFMKGWKQRLIVVREPVSQTEVALAR